MPLKFRIWISPTVEARHLFKSVSREAVSSANHVKALEKYPL
jgi:hypothetical protein